MAIVVTEHHPLETAARLGEILRDHGHRLRVVKLHAGDSLPEDLDNIDGLVSMGGPMGVAETDQHDWIEPEMAFIKQAHDAGLPVTGICLGAQLIAKALGGEVATMDQPEIGWGEVETSFFGTVDPILFGVPWKTPQFHAHGDEVTKCPPGGTPIPLMSTKACKAQAFRVGMTTYGFQFHFEWNRELIGTFLETFKDWVTRSGFDADRVRSECDSRYDLYRHIGDRLCENLSTLVYPLDKRRSA
ncbi:type 1 glutamine amidotransferase [Mucisphaera calidilacus]|uniref:GMP synthase [glutamine-hydrolyzing] n=1 Tax=Mucisphaera calidilacus TaxID=2527982 RepID=A0A518BZX9_9BACT|nr:type 1 glutamine amidotransferase [Mucisphaera calidilacus]QDU72525.1 GMP synthase [glutamine-hydrolyzing] [Mucisphaera calidilacus]